MIQVASGGVQQSTATLAQTKALKEIFSTLSDPVTAVNEVSVRELAGRLFKNNQHLGCAHHISLILPPTLREILS